MVELFGSGLAQLHGSNLKTTQRRHLAVSRRVKNIFIKCTLFFSGTSLLLSSCAKEPAFVPPTPAPLRFDFSYQLVAPGGTLVNRKVLYQGDTMNGPKFSVLFIALKKGEFGAGVFNLLDSNGVLTENGSLMDPNTGVKIVAYGKNYALWIDSTRAVNDTVQIAALSLFKPVE